jgi:hypothetical protein
MHHGPEHNTLQSDAGYVGARPESMKLSCHGQTIQSGHFPTESEAASLPVYWSGAPT